MRAGDKMINLRDINETLSNRIANLIDYRANSRDTVDVCTDLLRHVHEALQQPIMPEHPSDELLDAVLDGAVTVKNDDYWRGVATDRYNALRAALSTPPKPKMKTVWKFSYTYNEGRSGQENRVSTYMKETLANEYRADVINSAKALRYSNISPVWSEEVENK